MALASTSTLTWTASLVAALVAKALFGPVRNMRLPVASDDRQQCLSPVDEQLTQPCNVWVYRRRGCALCY
ncbi:protein of unknown function (plasmid) [Pararobbsia alpina]